MHGDLCVLLARGGGINRTSVLSGLVDPVYTGLVKILQGQKLTRLHLAFTRDRRNWTNF